MKINRFWKVTALAAAFLIPTTSYLTKSRQCEIWTWGAGRNGQLGLGLETNCSFPKQIKGIKFIDISIGKSMSAGITADGTLYTWGKNRNGILGHHPPSLNVLIPRKIDTIQKVVQVSCGYSHICAVTESGQAYIWGTQQINSKFRQIGTTQTTRLTMNDVKPYKINLPNVKQVSCAGDYTTLVDRDGKVFIMGKVKVKSKDDKQPQSPTDIIEVDINDRIQKVESGLNFSLALNKNGKIYVWGNNNFGQLGTGSLKSIYEPQILEELSRQNIVDISCGETFSGAVTENGHVYTWGFGNEGQLGHGDKSDQFLPRKINIQKKITNISCGGGHTALLTDKGKLYMMGRGRQGQLGRQQKDEGSSGYSLLLKLVEQLPAKKINKVVCGTSHTMALMEEL